MFVKELEYDRDYNHITTRVYEFNDNLETINYKLLYQKDEFPDLPFGKVDWADYEDSHLNGFSHEVSFNDAEFINGEYVLERTDECYDNGPYNRSQKREISNRTYFNKKGLITKVEECGINENFIQKFTYDEEGFVIKESFDINTNLFNYKERINVYAYFFNVKLDKKVKLLKYSQLDKNCHIFYSYTSFGDLANECHIFTNKEPTLQHEIQMFYDYDEKGNWITRQSFREGVLEEVLKREYGDFSNYF